VVGRVSATVGQVCSVTLEPIDNELEDRIDLVFAPATAQVLVVDAGANATVEVPAVDAPEPLVDGGVDLGAVATEFLILCIDPYPRKAGAVFDPPAAGDESGHPFAALAVLKERRAMRDEWRCAPWCVPLPARYGRCRSLFSPDRASGTGCAGKVVHAP